MIQDKVIKDIELLIKDSSIDDAQTLRGIKDIVTNYRTKAFREVIKINISRFENIIESLEWLDKNHKKFPAGHTLEQWIMNQNQQAEIGLQQNQNAFDGKDIY